MPSTIDEGKFQSQETLDLSKPQGTAQGLPIKQIPIERYPCCVYKHPRSPFFVEEHRNVNHEVVHREVKSAEHRVHVCQNKAEHEERLADGWKNEPFIQLAPPDPMDDLYADVISEDIARKGGGKPAELDTVAAQKFLLSRGYACETPEGAVNFVDNLSAKERKGFLKELADFIADGKVTGK